MSQFPPPLVPANCSLSDFAFMPLDVRRLLTSETWVLASGEERAAAMCLWLESWHQIPAGSLPDNDRMLAHLAQCPNWSAVKEQALRGWTKCSDGRLYHRVVAEKALEAWIEKLLNAISGAIGNAKRWGVDMDIETLRVELAESTELLQTIAPQSRTLRKPLLHKNLAKVCAPDDVDLSEDDADLSPPDRPPIAPRIAPDSPPDRNRQGQGQGQRQGKEKKKHSASYDAIPDLLAAGVDRQKAVDWLAVRKAKRAAETKTAIAGVLKNIAAYGISADEGIQICCERGWAGFEGAWLNARASPDKPVPVSTNAAVMQRWLAKKTQEVA